MSFASAEPNLLAAAAADLTGLRSTISEAHTVAAASTSAIAPAAADEVSAAIASLFSSHAQEFEALSARAQDFHAQFVQALTRAAGAYGSTESTSAAALATMAAAGRLGRGLNSLAKIGAKALQQLIPDAIADSAKALDDARMEGQAIRVKTSRGVVSIAKRAETAAQVTRKNLVSTGDTVIATGEGEAATILRYVGNNQIGYKLYQIEVDVEGQIIRTLHLGNRPGYQPPYNPWGPRSVPGRW